eukprot:jgi/Botrbrau1/10216/Bobra.0362s0006.1
MEGKESFLRLAADRGCPCEVRAVYFAARSGSLPTLELVCSLARVASGAALHSFNFSDDDGALTWLLNRSAIAAAGGGHAECLEALLTWFEKQGLATKVDLCEAAASGGHLECLEILQRAGCVFGDGVAGKAARAGHFECLQYITSHAEGLNKRGLLIAVAEGGNSHFLAYGLDRWPHDDLHGIMEAAISGKSTACMEVLYRHGYKAVPDPHQHPALLAISCCSIECLELALQESGHPERSLLDTAAAAWAGEAMLRLVHGLGGVISFRTVFAAAKAGNPGALHYALQHGGRSHSTAIVAAFRSGSVACLQLLHKHPQYFSVPMCPRQHGNQIHKCLKDHPPQTRPSVAVLRYMCDHMNPRSYRMQFELKWQLVRLLDLEAQELLKELDVDDQDHVRGGLNPHDWQKVMCLARCRRLPTLPPRLTEMVQMHRERAVSLANCFFQAAKLDRIWGGDDLPGAAGWRAMARLPPGLRERIAAEAHLCIRRG